MYITIRQRRSGYACTLYVAATTTTNKNQPTPKDLRAYTDCRPSAAGGTVDFDRATVSALSVPQSVPQHQTGPVRAAAGATILQPADSARARVRPNARERVRAHAHRVCIHWNERLYVVVIFIVMAYIVMAYIVTYTIYLYG